ncbi:hypothetical protein [Verrucomicrobium sp. 3C]|uniref:hypothetical protein n=1 Tax=Verrucomicrobium sp. 3C TaxID=1134055 RepID=UPI00036B5CCA|nr:hypothetical protein [Verrucomicrobium sp. 3C]
MKLRCAVDSVEALRRGIDAPESTVLELNPSILSPAEREWLAGAVRKGESASQDQPAPLIFPYPIPAPSVEALREAIAARIADGARAPASAASGVATRFDQAPRQGERPAITTTPAPAPSNPLGEAAKAAGFLGLGAIMGGMLDRVFGPHAQPPSEVILEQNQPREGSWGEPGRQEPSGEPSSCCDSQEGDSDPSGSLADDDLDDSGGSDGGYDLV